MTQVNLRQNQATPLTIAQADESLVHLSNIVNLSNNAALYTGGEYRTSGNIIVNLPTDGNEFSITVAAGTAQLNAAAGDTVDGATNPVVGAGSRRTYWKIGNDWKLQTAPSSVAPAVANVVTNSTAINANDSLYWVNSATPTALTIPANLPLNHVFRVIRPSSTAAVDVVPTAPDTAINPATGGADPTGFTLNQPGEAVFTKLANGWHVAAST